MTLSSRSGAGRPSRAAYSAGSAASAAGSAGPVTLRMVRPSKLPCSVTPKRVITAPAASGGSTAPISSGVQVKNAPSPPGESASCAAANAPPSMRISRIRYVATRSAVAAWAGSSSTRAASA